MKPNQYGCRNCDNSCHRYGRTEKGTSSEEITFKKKSEWKKFIRHLGENYNIDDDTPTVEKSLKPSEGLKK